MFDAGLVNNAQALLFLLRERGFKMASVESCTGGLIAGLMTTIAGASDVFERGWVTYSNDAKVQEVGVPPALIVAHGAVSQPVAQAMAEGALKNAPVDMAVSVTGIAGPGGGSADKPVGMVCLAVARCGHPSIVETQHFTGNRDEIRQQSVARALQLLAELARR